MAVKGRTWEPIDHEIADMLGEQKEKSGMSYRAIAEQTGINYMRISDIIHHTNGTPTIAEYLRICSAFGLDPVATLQSLLASSAPRAPESSDVAPPRKSV